VTDALFPELPLPFLRPLVVDGGGQRTRARTHSEASRGAAAQAKGARRSRTAWYWREAAAAAARCIDAGASACHEACVSIVVQRLERI